MNLLQAMIEEERAKRATAQAQADAIEAERAAAVKALHDAFEPFETDVGSMMLKGDRKPVMQCERQSTHYHRYDTRTTGLYRGPTGVQVSLGYGQELNNRQVLVLEVIPRIAASAAGCSVPLRVRLRRVCDTYGSPKMPDPIEWSTVNAPEQVQALLRELVKELAS